MVRKSKKIKIKKIQKEIDKLKRKAKEMELRPCYGDADLAQREKDIMMHKKKINEMEREVEKNTIHKSRTGMIPRA
jgi:hypothetical protein